MGFERLIDFAWVGLPRMDRDLNRSNFETKKHCYLKFLDSGLKEINSIGSCLEYGDLATLVTEETQGLNLGEFALTKLAILDFLQESQIPYRWFRPFYVIGPGQHTNSLLQTAIRELREKGIFVPKSPEKAFDFIGVNDVTSGISEAVRSESCLGIINLGSGVSTTAEDAINIVRAKLGLQLQYSLHRDGLRADSRKIRGMTNWSESETLNQVIQSMIDTMEKS